MSSYQNSQKMLSKFPSQKRKNVVRFGENLSARGEVFLFNYFFIESRHLLINRGHLEVLLNIKKISSLKLYAFLVELS